MDEHIPVTLEMIRDFALTLPGVEEQPASGKPAFRVRKRLMAWLRDDGATLVVRTTFAARDFLMQTQPQTYYITDHYVGYPYILVRLATVDFDDLCDLLEAAWRLLASKRQLQQRSV